MKQKMNKLLYLCAVLLCFSMLYACSNPSSETGDQQSDQAVNDPISIKVGPSSTGEGDPLKRFENEILAFEKADEKDGFKKGATLFIGSSSIRMWETLAEDMTPYPVLNRGFGGSTIPEVLTYYSRIVIPYEPTLIFLYCGENDIAEGATPEEVFQTFNAFVQACEFKFPTTKVAYISMKPSLARKDMWPLFQKGNQLIKELIDTKRGLRYIDSSTTMLLEDGSIDPSIFIEDGLHMNAKGYEGWAKTIRPVLEELYPIKHSQ